MDWLSSSVERCNSRGASSWELGYGSTKKHGNLIDFTASVNTVTENEEPNAGNSRIHSNFMDNSSGAPTYPSIGGQIHLIPNFSGEDETSVEKFLESVRIVSHLSGWNEQQTLGVARLRLSGAAADFVTANPHIVDSYANFSLALKQRFNVKISPFMLERMFTTCMQKPLESVAEFSTRLRNLGNKLRESMRNPQSESSKLMMEDRLLAQFLIGLREEIGRFVLVRNPKGIVEAEAYATMEEASIRNYQIRTNSVQALQFDSPHEWSINLAQQLASPKQNRTWNGPLNSSERPQVSPPAERSHRDHHGNRRINSSPRTCYRCGLAGHIARSCPAREDSSRGCYKCGERTHDPRNCPLVLCGKCGKMGHFPIRCPTGGSMTGPGNAPAPTNRSGETSF